MTLYKGVLLKTIFHGRRMDMKLKDEIREFLIQEDGIGVIEVVLILVEILPP